MPRPPYSDAAIEAAIEALTDVERLRDAQDVVTRAAPGLQRVLNQALFEGGWFAQAHEEQVLRTATIPDVEERLHAVRMLLAEETRLGMLVGVAVGFELLRQLESDHPDTDEDPGAT